MPAGNDDDGSKPPLAKKRVSCSRWAELSPFHQVSQGVKSLPCLKFGWTPAWAGFEVAAERGRATETCKPNARTSILEAHS